MYKLTIATHLFISSNVHTQSCYTPLHAAIYYGHYDVVRSLMEANADKDMLNEVIQWLHL